MKAPDRHHLSFPARVHLVDLIVGAMALLAAWATFSGHRALAWSTVLAVLSSVWLLRGTHRRTGAPPHTVSENRAERLNYRILWIGVLTLFVGDVFRLADVVDTTGGLLCLAVGVRILVSYVLRLQRHDELTSAPETPDPQARSSTHRRVRGPQADGDALPRR